MEAWIYAGILPKEKLTPEIVEGLAFDREIREVDLKGKFDGFSKVVKHDSLPPSPLQIAGLSSFTLAAVLGGPLERPIM